MTGRRGTPGAFMSDLARFSRLARLQLPADVAHEVVREMAASAVRAHAFAQENPGAEQWILREWRSYVRGFVNQ